MAEFTTIANRDELKPGECKVVEADGKTLALYNVEGTFYATDNTCLHQGGPLGDGDLDDKIITCPWHFWQFDVTTGENIVDPGTKVKCFKLQIERETIQLKNEV